MIETRVIQVRNEPQAINKANEMWAVFGWSVLSVQVTHTQDTKTYSKGLDWYTGDKTVETTTINYATITYQRDTNMVNYRQLAALQNELETLADEDVQPKTIKVMTNKDAGIAIGLYFAASALVMLIWRDGGIMWMLPFAAPIGYYFYKKNKMQELFDHEQQRCKKRQREIADRCEKILEEAKTLS